MARALAGVVDPAKMTVVVNVGDDEIIYGLHVAADLDTVTYTLAGSEGAPGWGIAGDTFRVIEQMAQLGVDTTFRLGDRDLANCLYRTMELADGRSLSAITAHICASLGVGPRVVPATDDPLRTEVAVDGGWLPFQEYFVIRGHRDEVTAVRYQTPGTPTAAPGVLAAIAAAELVVIAPSNPPLSIWPILAVPSIRAAIEAKERVVAVSPLFGGKALKGPADRVLASLGLPPGSRGILAAYDGMLTALVVDDQDASDVALTTPTTRVVATDTRITDPAAGRRFAAWLLDTMLR